MAQNGYKGHEERKDRGWFFFSGLKAVKEGEAKIERKEGSIGFLQLRLKRGFGFYFFLVSFGERPRGQKKGEVRKLSFRG